MRMLFEIKLKRHSPAKLTFFAAILFSSISPCISQDSVTDKDSSNELGNQVQDKTDIENTDAVAADPANPPSADQQTEGKSPSSTGPRQSSMQPPAPPVAILPATLPNVSRRAMNVKRDRGDLPAIGKLASVKNLLKDPTPPSGYDDELLERIASLNEISHAQGNQDLVGNALGDDPAGLRLTAIEIGEMANLLLTDRIFSGSFPESARFSQEILSSNDFALDIASVWDHLSTESFPTASYAAVAGRDLSLSGGTYSYESLIDGHDTFLLAAARGMDSSGTISFTGSAARVVLIGGDKVSSSPGSSLDSALADLVVASRSDWSVSDAAFAAGSKIYLRSLGDLSLNNVELTATDQVRLEALMDLSIDSTRFSSGVLEIQMRATTIDLRNVDFPSTSIVDLHTLKGGLDGKYPTFGSANRSYGRVNFLQDVRQGGNLLNDRTSFDLHGTRIKISKLP